jgi:MFS transporter, DHA1 family, inner membrane transport protein
MSVLTSAALFCVFTYIAPTLLDVTQVSPHAVTLTLLLFGVGITVGNFAGGALSDWRPMTFLSSALLTLIATLVALYFALPYVVPAVVMILIWGMVQFATGAPLQSRIVEQAAAAPNLVSTLNQGAFNLGNATGASLGGMMLTIGLSYRQLPIASAIVTFVTLTLALISARLDRKHSDARIAEELSIL